MLEILFSNGKIKKYHNSLNLKEYSSWKVIPYKEKNKISKFSKWLYLEGLSADFFSGNELLPTLILKINHIKEAAFWSWETSTKMDKT